MPDEKDAAVRGIIEILGISKPGIHSMPNEG
jgi:hypothetical protein